MLSPPPRPGQEPHADEGRQHLRKWAEKEDKRYLLKAAGNPRKLGDLTIEVIISLVEPVSCGNGCYEDFCFSNCTTRRWICHCNR